MIKHIWSVLCKESIIDVETNTISLIGILEEITADINPNVDLPVDGKLSININYEVVSMWSREVSDASGIEVKVEFCDPNNVVVNEFSHKATFPDKTVRLRTRFKIRGINANISGNYQVNVYLRHPGEDLYKKISSLPLMIKINRE